MRTVRNWAAVLFSFILLFVFCTTALAADGEVYALKTTTIRKTASTGGASIGTLYAGSVAERLGTSGSFTLIRYAGLTGYALSADVAVYIDGGGASVSREKTVNMDISVLQTRMYMANAGVNVRAGAGTRYWVMGALKKGEYVEGAVNPIGNWTEVIYNGKAGYVSTKYITPVSSASSTSTQSDSSALAAQSNIVYARRKTEATTRAGDGKTVSTLLMGARAVSKEVSGRYTLVETQGKTGYVSTSDLVSVTGTGAYEMSARNGWRYAAGGDVYALLIPIEGSTYRIGRFNKNEAVWALAGNAYWTQVYVQGRVAYVLTPELLTKPTSGKAKGTTGPYAPGTILTVKSAGGAATYASTLLDSYIPIYETSAYGMIKKGTKLTVMYCMGDLVCVLWDDDRSRVPAASVDFATNLHAAAVLLTSVG